MASITVTKKKQKQKIKEPQIKITWKEIKRQKVLLIWSAIIVVYGVIFCYLPLGGWLMAFQNYKPKDGLLHSSFVGLAKFQQLFSDATFLRVIRNTLAMGVINLVVTFVMAIVFAILLNEVKSQGGKKVVQTISYLPHFVSWVIIASIAKNIFNDGGVVDSIFGKNLHLMSSNSPLIWVTIILINCWKEVGWNAIIYLSAMAGIDPGLYEAADMDGASRLQKIWHITLPGIRPTIIVLLIMSIGGALNVGMERQMLLSNPLVEDHTMVLSWFSYKRGIGNSNYGLGTAIGVFQSAVSVTLLLIANKIAGLVGEDKLM